MFDLEFEKIERCLNLEDFDLARQEIKLALEKISIEKPEYSFWYQLKLYGFLTDLGNESLCKEDLSEAIEFFEKNEITIKQHITAASYYYNLANAENGLCKIYYRNSPGVKPTEIIKTILQLPVNHYWEAFKAEKLQGNKSLKFQILINLANSLNNVGRIIEALQFLDMALEENSKFSQALVSRADTLYYLSRITNCSYTAALFTQIFKSYDDAIKTNSLPPSLLTQCHSNKEEMKNTLHFYGFGVDNIESELRQSMNEYNALSDYRKYCLNNFITLNEHALYCKCIAAEKDDIQIGVPHALFKGEIVPKLELLLNRMKSEYGLARWLFYQYTADPNKINMDVLFTELYDEESIDGKVEMLRSSFRSCYGILDKIAYGICRLYDLADNEDNILFEAFWNPRSKPERWEKINKIKNIHLSALYSIANDLNTKNGQLKAFKEWRNKLEHRILILTKKPELNPDILKVYSDKDFIEVISIDEFEEKTLHLLQLVRAAIFSFVYCVRLETIDYPDYDLNTEIIGYKNL